MSLFALEEHEIWWEHWTFFPMFGICQFNLWINDFALYGKYKLISKFYYTMWI